METSDLAYVAEAVAECDLQTGGSSSSAGHHIPSGAQEGFGFALQGIPEVLDDEVLEDFRPADFGVSGSSSSHGMQASEWVGVL